MSTRESTDPWYEYRIPSGQNASHRLQVRAAARVLAETVHALCPDGEQRATALKLVREAVYLAEAALSGEPRKP